MYGDIISGIVFYGNLIDMWFPTYSKLISKYLILYDVCEYNYIDKIGINISHERVTPNRVENSSIMEWAYKYLKTPLDLKEISRVRVYNGVSSIRKITSTNGITRN